MTDDGQGHACTGLTAVLEASTRPDQDVRPYHDLAAVVTVSPGVSNREPTWQRTRTDQAQKERDAIASGPAIRSRS